MAIKNIVALAGGVGGAKLADGLARVLPAGALTVIVNIADDFRHYGLHISPDLDTVMYTLSEYANPTTGWGVRDESWNMLSMLETYGEQPWFRLGDRDLATHLLRTSALDRGETLTEITQKLAKGLGIQQTMLPACDQRFATMVDTVEHGTLGFQEYFVGHRWQPTVTKIWYDSDIHPTLTDATVTALEAADAVVICPSNPILSIDPILSIGNMRTRVQNRSVPCIAVSPLLNGKAVKGPAAKIMPELGHKASTQGILDFYEGIIDTLVVTHGDAPPQSKTYETTILMKTIDDRVSLAKDLLDYLEKIT